MGWSFGGYAWLATVMLMLTACVGVADRQAADVVAVPASYELVEGAFAQVESRESLLHVIAQLEAYAARHAGHYASRARLANAYTLLGAGYSASGAAKARAYNNAMAAAEEAFETNGSYQLARLNGQSFAQRLDYLGDEQMEALEFWKTAMFYSFREASGPVAKLWRYPRLNQAVAIMQRQEVLDRQAMWGNNLMSWGIFYLAQPEWYGGDRNKSREYLAEAVAVTQRNIVPRWGRGKYFAVAMGDMKMFRDDLSWVAAQPLEALVGYRPWNRMLQNEARQLLAQSFPPG